MQNQKPFVNFGKVLQTIAIFSILNAIFTVFCLITLDILPRFGVNLIDPIALLSYISLVFGIISLILTIILLINTNRVKELVQHIHFSQFYSRLGITFIISVFYLVYVIVAPMVVGLFVTGGYFVISMNIVALGGIVIAFIQNIIIMVAWGNFLHFTKMQQFPSNIIRSSNLIKIGYTIVVINSIFDFFSIVFIILLYLSFPFGYYLALVIAYTFLIADILFTIIPPIILIVGKFQLGSSIQLISHTTTEPKLDNYHDTQSSQFSIGKSKTCLKCGSVLPERVDFCPNCGNSVYS